MSRLNSALDELPSELELAVTGLVIVTILVLVLPLFALHEKYRNMRRGVLR